MKQMKKIASLLLALALIMGLAVSASAADVDIKVENATNNNHYDFYRVFDATPSAAGDEITYSVNTRYNKALRLAIIGDAEDTTMKLSEMVAHVAALKDDAEGMREFADDLYAAIKTRTLNYDYTVQATGNEVKATVAPGYYLVAERVTDKADTVSLVMMDTAGNKNITISTKEDDPTVKKWIDLGDDNLVKQTEVSNGEVLNFKVVGTISSKYANYEEYTYRFVDDCSGGLTLDQSSIKVFVKNGENTYDVTDDFTVSDFTVKGFKLEAELMALDAAHTEFEITGSTEIIATYSATCNGQTVMNGGYYNNVKLEFENDPYNEQEGITTGETPKDRVAAFGFKVTVNKVDGNDVALNGAGFTLYKWDATAGDYVQYGDEIVQPSSSTFEFPAMESGKYKLVETTVPAGYNKAADIEFEIVPTYAADGQSLQALVVKDGAGNVISGDGKTFTLGLDANDRINGTMSLTVKNQAGTELPDTGGIGTTIFYIVGGMLVLAAAVLLITKKRMVNAE